MTTHRNANATPPRPLVRLEAYAPLGSRLTVERTLPGAIRSISILTTGPAEGHDFLVDEATVDQVVAHGDGVPGRWTHGGMCEDGLGRHLGRWERLRKESFRLCRACEKEATAETCPCGQPTSLEHRALGDFQFAPSAHRIKPDGLVDPAPVYLMQRALENPRSLGISIVARLGYEEVEAEEVDEGAQAAPKRLARIQPGDLRRADWVADPAANPVGLDTHKGEGGELLGRVHRELDRLVALQGAGKTKLRALAFLSRYFKDDLGAEEPDVDRLEHELALLRAENEGLRIQIEGKKEQEQQGYLETLKKESAELQAPIPTEDLERVAAFLRDGQAEAAKALGEAFLARSKAQGQVAFTRGGALPLAPKEEGEHEKKKTSVEVQARMLRTRHWKAEPTGDGTDLQAAPPRGR